MAIESRGKNWVFGVDAWLIFQDDGSLPQTKNFTTETNFNFTALEGCDCLSFDQGASEGELRLITNGAMLVKIETNGSATLITGDLFEGNLNTALSIQAVMIVKHPGLPEYYIFGVGDWTTSATDYRPIMYRTYDGSALGSLQTLKSAGTGFGFAENITSTLHKNGEDIWILTKSKGDNKLYAWLLSNFGLNNTPVVSTAGFSYTGSNRFGQMKVSPNGNKVVLVMGSSVEGDGNPEKVVLWAFNKETGVFYNEKVLLTSDSANYRVIGCDFTIDSKCLYVSIFLASNRIYKINLKDVDTPIISYILSQGRTLGAVQRGYDNRIYIAVRGQNHIIYINDPDNLETTNFTFSQLSLPLGTASQLGLPTIPQIQSFVPTDYRVFHGNKWYSVCAGDDIRLYDLETGSFKKVNPGDKYWDDGLKRWTTIECALPVPPKPEPPEPQPEETNYDILGFFNPIFTSGFESYPPTQYVLAVIDAPLFLNIGFNYEIEDDRVATSSYEGFQTVVDYRIEGNLTRAILQTPYDGNVSDHYIIIQDGIIV